MFKLSTITLKHSVCIENLGLAPSHLNPTASLAVEEDFNDEEAWGEIKKQAEANSKHIKNDDDFDDDDDDDDSDVTISDIFPLVTSTPPAHLKGGNAQRHEQAVNSAVDGMMASTPPTSALVTKLFPQLKPKRKASVSRHYNFLFCEVSLPLTSILHWDDLGCLPFTQTTRREIFGINTK